MSAPHVPLGGWEFYTVLADDSNRESAADTSVCCGADATPETRCCGGGSDEA